MTGVSGPFKTHPEMQEGEVFWSNIHSVANLEAVGWTTKRLGEVAYDSYGKEIKGMRPVFIQRTELSEAGVNPDKVW